MDVFFEQIIKKKMTAKDWALYLAIWGAAGLLTLLCFIILQGMSFLPIVAVLFFAWKLSGKLFVEYEYIFTNGDLDIDKITAKSSRKRIVAVNCTSAERFGRFTPELMPSFFGKKIYTFCDKADSDAMYMIVPHKNEGMIVIIFAPDKRIKEAIEKAVPRIAL